MLTQSMVADLGHDGIRVNAIAPGVIETAMTESTRTTRSAWAASWRASLPAAWDSQRNR
jgi:NAD(P)-dependent dehydrogenase (short-subunit alcohol dehydrogenase family)